MHVWIVKVQHYQKYKLGDDMKPINIACVALMNVALASTAVAQELELWGASEYWDVMVDPTLGNGCLIQSEFTDGSVVRIGFDRNQGYGYVRAFNSAWGDIIEGETYPILFALESRYALSLIHFGQTWARTVYQPKWFCLHALYVFNLRPIR